MIPTPIKRMSAAARCRSTMPFVLAAALLATVVLPSPSHSATVQQQREERRTFPARQGVKVDLENLAGAVVVEGTTGGDIEIVATVHAADGDRADAQTLLGLLEINFVERNDEVNVRVDYPVERFDVYRYPGDASGSTFNTNATYQNERVRVTSRNDDDAVTLYVDFSIRVPPGVNVDVENDAGNVSASGMRGDFRGDTGSGDVSARDIVGDVEGDTGSGDVRAEGITGDVLADTGSGNVEIRDVTGDISGDTGSGNIEAYDVRADRIEVDTGSGDVHLERVSGSISADTGSGDIVVEDLTSGASIMADTGSGDVRLAGDFSQVRQIYVDVSSGDVEIDMSAHPGLSITIETGSGSIDVDIPDLRTERSRRTYFRGSTGDGSADVTIDTGSGSILIRGR